KLVLLREGGFLFLVQLHCCLMRDQWIIVLQAVFALGNNSMSKNIDDKVIDFITNYVGLDAKEINKRTTVNDELGVDGDDGMDMLDSFSNEFGVDMSSIKDIYFCSEGLDLSVIIYPILRVLDIFGLIDIKRRHISPLTVSTMIESAKNKVWTDTNTE
ncbi:DUF1493 family protein, partial [Thiolapillus sp.]